MATTAPITPSEAHRPNSAPTTAAAGGTTPAPAPAPAGVASPPSGATTAATAIQIHELSRALQVVTVRIAPPTQQQADSNGSGDNSNNAEKDPVTTRTLLQAADPKKQFLPGQPRVSLQPPTPESPAALAPASENEVLQYLRKAHLTDELDNLLPYMKYIFVPTPSHKHIMPIHHQKSHAREIVVDEYPGLHLVWYYEQIFIKPIPAYMYSQAFWTYIKDADSAVYQASLGFMRTYYYLIQYDIDYQMACEKKLIPKLPGDDGRFPSYEDFCAFISAFNRDVDNASVSRRFRYGELRLTRINKTALLFKHKLAYFQIQGQWGSYLSHILAPIITIFAILSVILNAMQVTLAAHEVGPNGLTPNWWPFLSVSLYFPVFVICLICVIVGTALFGVLIMGLKDLIWAKTIRHRRKKGTLKAEDERSYGIIW